MLQRNRMAATEAQERIIGRDAVDGHDLASQPTLSRFENTIRPRDQATTELKKALMHKLFTEGLRNEPQKQTEIGPVPESWEVMELGKYARVLNGYAFKSTDYVVDGVRLIRISNVSTGFLYCARGDAENRISPTSFWRPACIDDGGGLKHKTPTNMPVQAPRQGLPQTGLFD